MPQQAVDLDVHCMEIGQLFRRRIGGLAHASVNRLPGGIIVYYFTAALQVNCRGARSLKPLQRKHKIVMDSYDAKAFYKRAYALMGSLSGLGDDAMRLLRGVDLQVVEALGIVFLAA